MESVIAVPAVVGNSVRMSIDDDSQIGAARRAAVALGNTYMIGSEATGRLAIVVTEAATNIARHAGRGELVLRGFLDGTTPSIEILALDHGPGIADVSRALRDGYSTIGTAGQGLGAIQRLSETFEVYSQVPEGTALLARVGRKDRQVADESLTGGPPSIARRFGVICVPIPGEDECGDAWRLVVHGSRTTVLVVDGLGHGPGAAAAAAVATATFLRMASARRAPEMVIEALNGSMRDTRGAAASAADLDDEAGTARFCGVGNVDGRILTGESTAHLVPQNGIVGHALPTLRPGDAAWHAGARLVLHSDGISARWRVESYPGLEHAHPALMAGVLYRDFARARDDVTILVLDAAPVAA